MSSTLLMPRSCMTWDQRDGEGRCAQVAATNRETSKASGGGRGTKATKGRRGGEGRGGAGRSGGGGGAGHYLDESVSVLLSHASGHECCNYTLCFGLGAAAGP